MIDAADASYALDALKARQRTYRTYRAYADGDQPLYFATDAFQTAFGSMFKRLAYNRCRAVVDAFANRLIVTGWESSHDDAVTDPLGDAAHDIWDRNGMPKRQGELFAEAFRAGDAYVIVWPGADGNARIDINKAHLIYPIYDDEDTERLVYAVKCWPITHGTDKGRWRVNVYDAEVITRWISKGSSDEFPEKLNNLIPYEGRDGAEISNPYGRVPVFHFGNNADTGSLGYSELVDVIPLQDGLNKSVADMLIAGEYVAFPQRWVVGAAPVRNQFTGEEEEQFKAAVDRVWAIDSTEARFGQFDPADMNQYTAAQDAWDLKISRVSSVPVHWLSMTGEFPSGESLKTAEGPFVSKCKDRQVGFGDTLSDVMTFALQVDSGATTPLDTPVTPIWAPAETRSDQEALNAAAMKKSLGVPDEQIWAELGYSQDEIAQFAAAKAEAAQRQQEMFARSFDRGEVPIGER